MVMVIKKTEHENFIFELTDDFNFYKNVSLDFLENEIISQKVVDNKIVTTESINELLQLIEINAKSLIEETLLLINNKPTISVAVIGDFSCGKSSFINSLLGSDICPVAINPTTSSITKFIYSEQAKITIVNENRQISENEYKKLSQHDDSKKRISYEIEYGYPFEKLEFITLFDTPGFNNNQNKNDELITLKNATKAEVILFVMDINKGTIADDILKKIRRIKDNSDNQKWYLIVNQADTKSKIAAEKIVKALRIDYTNFFEDIFLYSAKESLNALDAKDTLSTITQNISSELLLKMDNKSDFDFIIQGKKENRTGTVFSLEIEGSRFAYSNKTTSYSTVKDGLLQLLNKSSQTKKNTIIKNYRLKKYAYRKSRLNLIEQLESLKIKNELNLADFYKDEMFIKEQLNNLSNTATLQRFINSCFYIHVFDHSFLNTIKYGTDDSRIKIVEHEKITLNYNLYRNWLSVILEQINDKLDVYLLDERLKNFSFTDFYSALNNELSKVGEKLGHKLQLNFKKIKLNDDTKIKSEDNLRLSVVFFTSELQLLIEKLIIWEYSEYILRLRLAIEAESNRMKNKHSELLSKVSEFKSQKHIVKFQFRPNKNYKNVYLTGCFNDWKKKDIKMKINGPFFEINIELPKDRYMYCFLADSTIVYDHNCPETTHVRSKKTKSILYV